MNKQILLVPLLGTALVASSAYARDDHLRLKIDAALNSTAAQGKIDSEVKLFWGDQKYPAPQQTFGSFTANKKTNAFNKSDEEACQINFASAVIALQERARREGGNAVVNIHSYYKKDDISSETEYECGAGTFLSGVTLRGTVVKLP
ncbi:MAG: hypothetical protein P4L83_00695 [Nevskia sp.]|nr:hypothetical protein [Nevskia sp.]